MNDTITADYSATPANLASILEAMIAVRQPVMIWGQPGVGKSQIARDTAAALGQTYIDIRLPLMDTVDFRGIPTVTDRGTTRWAPPEFLPPTDSSDGYLINLEELPSAAPSLQVTAYQLTLDRRVGEYTLPEGATVIACGNRQTDRAVAYPMPTALRSRFVHVDLETDVADWSAWAIDSGIATEVIFFLQFRPDLLNTFDPKGRDHTFACPRTWEFVSRILQSGHSLDDDALRLVLRGTVGEGAAIEFVAFLSMWRKLPHPASVIADPAGSPVFADDPQTLIALCGALYRQADDTSIDSISAYARRIRPEVGEFLMSSIVRRSPELQTTRAYIAWVTETQGTR